jgi:hypothetical protein
MLVYSWLCRLGPSDTPIRVGLTLLCVCCTLLRVGSCRCLCEKEDLSSRQIRLRYVAVQQSPCPCACPAPSEGEWRGRGGAARPQSTRLRRLFAPPFDYSPLKWPTLKKQVTGLLRLTHVRTLYLLLDSKCVAHQPHPSFPTIHHCLCSSDAPPYQPYGACSKIACSSLSTLTQFRYARTNRNSGIRLIVDIQLPSMQADITTASKRPAETDVQSTGYQCIMTSSSKNSAQKLHHIFDYSHGALVHNLPHEPMYTYSFCPRSPSRMVCCSQSCSQRRTQVDKPIEP